MATLSHSESRRLYSWWWDSHISPKNSKWLQENLTDMDAKVKGMIKLIEEDADSFARRAEMYYKKRPELMKLVEEFYRAYRALAERYDHATVELRHAHQTMAKAFPNQAQYMLADDSPSGPSDPGAEPHTTEVPHAFLKSDDPQKDALGPSSSHNNLKKNGGNSELSECGINKMGLKRQNDLGSEQAREAETEVQILKIALAKIRSEKDAIILQYKNSLEKLSEMERELIKAQKDAGSLDERASTADIEIKILKEALEELRSKRDAGLVQYNQCLERIATLETMLSLVQQEAKGLDERANKAETEVKDLKEEISRLEAEKDAGLLLYKQSLEKISILETKLSLAEENSKMLKEKVERADMEVKALRKHLAKLKEEKEAVSVLYKQCLETIARIESEILQAQESSERLNTEIMMGAEKLKSAEHHCDMLERSNHSLQLEADNLVQKIARKDQELLEKHTELQRLQTMMQEEHSRFLQIEAALQTLQKLYSQSLEEQKSLALELQYGLRLLNDLELSKQGFKEEMQQIVVENRTLHELNLSATVAINNQQMEICQLKEIKEKLERAVAVKAEESNALQQEIQQIKDEIQGLTKRCQNMLEQAEAVGLNPECFAAHVKELQSENLKLKEAYKREQDEKEALLEKSKDIDKLSRENALMESSLSRLNNELDGLRDAAMKYDKSCQTLQEEKSVHVAEKAALLRQLQIITETMQKLFEKNTLLEKSLTDANIELEGLKAKSSSLKVVCESLNNEKSNLLNERSILVSQLETVEARLIDLEKRFTELEEKCSYLEKDKESTVNEVEKLHASLLAQKSEHANHKQSSENRLANLENLVHLLQNECQLGKKEFEEQLDKAVNAQLEVFVLQKFVEDLEEKNLALLVECQKYVEASKFSHNVILELEDENFEQQMEVEFLLDEIKQLKMKIQQVYGALQIDPVCGHDKRNKQEEIPILHILDNIEDLKGSLVKSQEEQQQLLVENSVLLTLLWQLQSDGAELESKNKALEQEFEIMREQHAMLKKDMLELQEINRQLGFKVTKGEERENTLNSELESMHVELIDLQGANLVLEEENSQVLEEKNSLLKSVLDLKNALSTTEIENGEILHEAVALSNLSLVYESFLTQKVFEQKALAENLGILHHMNNNLKLEVGSLREKFEEKVADNVYLSDSVERMDKELHETRNANANLSYQVALKEDLLQKKEAELSKMEQRLKAAEALNAEFCRNVTELKVELQESRLIKRKLETHMLELSEDRINQKKEIERLNEANRSYLSELGLLRQEVEQQQLREETLNFELLEKTYEFELWEAEAATFYFDLHISSISKALFENKVKELTGVCMSLEDENAAKSSEIELMRERISLLESEIGGLGEQLSAYIPVISSLKDDLASLELTALLQSNKTSDISNREHKDIVFETSLQEDSSENIKEDESLVISSAVSDLLNMQRRIRAVHNVLLEETERHVKEQTLTANDEAITEGSEGSNLKSSLHPENDIRRAVTQLTVKTARDLKSLQIKSENGSLMKDIPLDQASDSPATSRNSRRMSGGTDDWMLQLQETAKQRCDNPMVSEAMRQRYPPMEDVITCHHSDNTVQCPNSSSELEFEKELGVDKLELSKTTRETNQEGKRRKILERLASDAQKLNTIKMSVEDLKKKAETNKRSKKGIDIEYETVRRKIKEAEEAIVRLVDANDQLIKDIEESPSSFDRETSAELAKDGHVQRKRVMEQARRESEQIGRLQFEVQNMQYVLLKLADEKKNIGNNRISKHTGILLRDFIQGDQKSSKRSGKVCFCGCSRPSTKED